MLPGCAAWNQTSADVIAEHDVAMKTRDGVTLYADIYRPAEAERLPVLLKRTPYDKSGDDGLGRMMAARGYIVVIQDVRGRYTSEGEWYTFKHEIGMDTTRSKWAALCPTQTARWDVQRLVRGRNADAGGHRPSPASG